MVESQHQIDFIHSGGTLRLLDIGAIIADAPVISVKQNEMRYAPIGAEWSEVLAMGGAETAVTWTAVRNHASHAALHGFCLSHAAAFPSGKTGTLRITISGGEVWDVADAVISSFSPKPLADSGAFETVTDYSAAGGAFSPVSTLTLYAGIPVNWIHQTPESISQFPETL